MDKWSDIPPKGTNCIRDAKAWLKLKKFPILRVLGLVAACLCIMVCGSIYAFNAYANELKNHFELTQFQGMG